MYGKKFALFLFLSTLRNHEVDAEDGDYIPNFHFLKGEMSFREVFEHAPQCKECTADFTTPPFCIMDVLNIPDYKTKIALIFNEPMQEDYCYCDRTGSIFFAKDPTLRACTQIPDICKVLSKDVVCNKAGLTCDGSQWSTFHCVCKEGWQGQLCDVLTSVGQVVKNPILIHYLYAPLLQKPNFVNPGPHPGLYFVTESLGDDFRLIVDFGDGRRIQVGPSSFIRKNYKEECLTDVEKKIHFVGIRQCNLIPEGDLYGYGIFLDKGLDINFRAKDTIVPKNDSFIHSMRSPGRLANINIEVRNKNIITWRWDTFKPYVPHVVSFLECSVDLVIHGCGEESPIVKSIDSPLIFKASREFWPWMFFQAMTKKCPVIHPVIDQRWYIEDITDPEKADDWIPEKQLPVKYSLGADGNRKIVPAGILGVGKFMIIYDAVSFLKETNWDEKWEELYLQRKLCYFDIVADAALKVYVHTRSKSVPCNKPFFINVKNYNPRVYDNHRLTISWTCEGFTSTECGLKETKGIQPYTNILKCGVKYIFKAKVTHPKTTGTQTFEVEINSQDQDVEVEIECSKSCKLKVNPDRILHLRAMEIPPISNSWKWEIREVTQSDAGDEVDGSEDLVGELRQSGTLASICIIPPNRLTPGQEYRVYARTAAAYSSYSFVTNTAPEPSPKVGLCKLNGLGSNEALVAEFKIECDGWEDDDVPLSYKVYEILEQPGGEVEPLESSETPNFNVKLRRQKIMVWILDSQGYHTEQNFTVMLTPFTKRLNEDQVNNIITTINDEVVGNDLNGALSIIDHLTKQIEEVKLQISEYTALKLLDSLSQIDHFDEPFYLEKALNVLKRILNMKTLEPKQRADQLALDGSTLLNMYSDIAEDFSIREMVDSLDKDILSASVSEASCTILKQRDPVVEQDTVPENVHEEHVQRVNRATNSSLEAMDILGRMLIKNVKYQEQKYVTLMSCFNIITKNGNASQIRDESNNKVNFPDEYYRNESANVAIISVTDDTKLKSPNEIGVMGIVAEFSDSVPAKKGPVDITMTIPNYHSRNVVIAGEYKLTPACATEEKLDRSFDIHNIYLPDGDGIVVLNFANEMVGKVKLFAQQGYQPNHANASSSPILNSTGVYVGFSNRDHLKESAFYVALVGATEESRKMEYTFTCRILRCAVYNVVEFISRGCTFQKLVFHDPGKDPTIHCGCNLSSDARSSTTWYSVNLVVPGHHLIPLEVVPLFSAIHDRYYASYPVSFLYLALFFLLLVGYRLDRTDDRLRSVIFMEDNYPGDDHAYVIAVFTGQGIGSGTSSVVGIRIFGKNGFSRVHLLSHSRRQTLKGGHDDWFLMTTSDRLGRITKIQLWHNHAGKSPEWYCSKISVFDLRDHVKYDFFVERWFTFDVRVSLDEARTYEGKTATDVEVSKKWYLLVGGWIFSEMREKHHLASIFRRHPRSLYTRCQRVIIGVTFTMCTMLISMMFFTLEDGPADWPLVPFTWNDVLNGIKSSLISTAITFGVVFCFGQHKKYESKALNREPKFEVIDVSELKRRKFKDKVPPESDIDQAKWLKYIKPTPVEYKPVIFGVGKTKPDTLSTVYLFTGWIFACVTIMFMSVLIVKYGMKFGPKKTLVWALTFLTGTFTDGVIFGPIKVVTLGLLVAHIFKKSYLDSYTMQIKIDASELAKKKYLGRLKWNFKMRQNKYYKPAYTVELERFRSRRLNDRGFRYLLTHSAMVILLIIVTILLVVFIGVRDGFYHIRHLTELFTEGTTDQNAHRVWNKLSMFQFFSTTAVPAVHRVRWYNNKTLPIERNERKADPDSPRYQSHVRGFVKDYSNKLVGVPRLRQLRLSNSSFNNRKVPRVFQRLLLSGNLSALGPYYMYFGMDRNSYHPMWVPYNGYHGSLKNTWSYSSANSTATGVIIGKSLKQYGGGGYVTALSWNLGSSLRTLKILEIRNWITNRTRCIFLEINLFNNNDRQFSVVRFIVEALPAGPYWNSFQVEVITLHLSGRPEAQATVVLVTLLLCMLVIYSFLSIWHSSRNGLTAYMTSWRSGSDMLLIVVGILAMSSQYNRILRFSITTEYLDTLARDTYPSLFSTIAIKKQAEGFFSAFIAILVFNLCCTMFKFKMYQGMNRVLSTVWPLGLTGSMMLTFYSTLPVGLQSIILDSNLGSLFILKFLFKDEKFHKFTEESKIFYMILAPCIILLFLFHLGYLVYSFSAYKEPWKLPTFSINSRVFRRKKPKPLERRITGQKSIQPPKKSKAKPPKEVNKSKGILKQPKGTTEPSVNQFQSKTRKQGDSSRLIKNVVISKEIEVMNPTSSKPSVSRPGSTPQPVDSSQSMGAGTVKEPEGRKESRAKPKASKNRKRGKKREAQSITSAETPKETERSSKPPGSQTQRKAQKKDDLSQLIE